MPNIDWKEHGMVKYFCPRERFKIECTSSDTTTLNQHVTTKQMKIIQITAF